MKSEALQLRDSVSKNISKQKQSKQIFTRVSRENISCLRKSDYDLDFYTFFSVGKTQNDLLKTQILLITLTDSIQVVFIGLKGNKSTYLQVFGYSN